VVAHDLAAHDLVELVLQGVDFARQVSSMRSKGITQTSESSSATASQVWWSLTMPSRPEHLAGHLEAGHLVAAVLGGTQVLKKPVRMAYSEVNFSPLLKQRAAALDLAAHGHHFVERSSSCAFRPMGMHSSRRLQLEQATLMDWTFMLAI
jgi:hypothetical protein